MCVPGTAGGRRARCVSSTKPFLTGDPSRKPACLFRLLCRPRSWPGCSSLSPVPAPGAHDDGAIGASDKGGHAAGGQLHRRAAEWSCRWRPCSSRRCARPACASSDVPGTLNPETLFEPGERKAQAEAEMGPQPGHALCVTGAVNEWRYKVGVDGEPPWADGAGQGPQRRPGGLFRCWRAHRWQPRSPGRRRAPAPGGRLVSGIRIDAAARPATTAEPAAGPGPPTAPRALDALRVPRAVCFGPGARLHLLRLHRVGAGTCWTTCATRVRRAPRTRAQRGCALLLVWVVLTAWASLLRQVAPLDPPPPRPAGPPLEPCYGLRCLCTWRSSAIRATRFYIDRASPGLAGSLADRAALWRGLWRSGLGRPAGRVVLALVRCRQFPGCTSWAGPLRC